MCRVQRKNDCITLKAIWLQPGYLKQQTKIKHIHLIQFQYFEKYNQQDSLLAGGGQASY